MMEQTEAIIIAGKTDTGSRRPNNEDSYLIKADAGVCAVADGMGGAAAGEIASRLFTESVTEIFAEFFRCSEQETMQRVQRAFRNANERMRQHVQRHPKHGGMGCTAELLAICENRYIIGHVGDSRTYLSRSGKLRQLTHDHSLVQDHIDRGLIDPERVSEYRFRNVILRAVGTTDNLALDLVRGNVYPGDLFLLCSDGLSSMLRDAEIQKILENVGDLSQKIQQLVDRANLEGGLDNITVVLAQII